MPNNKSSTSYLFASYKLYYHEEKICYQAKKKYRRSRRLPQELQILVIFLKNAQVSFLNNLSCINYNFLNIYKNDGVTLVLNG